MLNTRRLPAITALVLTVVAGLLVRAVTDGATAKVGGVALYGTMIYVAVLVIRPVTLPLVTAGVAALVCWVVEFAQLTPFPATASEHSRLARLVLGSTFHPPDLAAYLGGILGAVLIHLAVHRLTASRNDRRAGTTLAETGSAVRKRA